MIRQLFAVTKLTNLIKRVFSGLVNLLQYICKRIDPFGVSNRTDISLMKLGVHITSRVKKIYIKTELLI